jgi:hypothetical protein
MLADELMRLDVGLEGNNNFFEQVAFCLFCFPERIGGRRVTCRKPECAPIPFKLKLLFGDVH